MRFQVTQTKMAALLSGVVLFAATASAQVASTPAGVGNFYQVNDHIFRGAQPSTDGFKSLAKMGVKTVIDLREPDERSAAEKKAVEADGMKYINVPMHGMETPSQADIAKVLAIFNDPTAGPVFVHCRRGADRTGTVVACYRISHDKWDNAKALSEAKADGMAWIQRAMANFVKHYQPQDIASAANAGAAATANVQ